MKYISASLLALGLFAFTACSDDDTPADPQPEEFIATDADFSDYQSWTQTIEPQVGPDPAGLVGGAHGAPDSTLTRYIFVDDENASRDGNGNFPLGTRFVKEVRMADGSVAAVTAMVKRGNGFNAGNKEWEWFLLESDGKIMQRGADLMENMCNGCHAQNTSKDYVFTK